MKQYSFPNNNALNPKAHKLFTSDPWQNVKAISSDFSNGDDGTQYNYKLNIYPIISFSKLTMKCVHYKPNVFIIDNFLNEHEINHLLNISRNNINRFESSYTQSPNAMSHRIYSSKRTSTCIFLQKSMDKIVGSIENKAANIIGVRNKNVEQLQIVRYTKGQRFDLHHDAGTLINETLRRKQRNLNNINNINNINNNTHSNVKNPCSECKECRERIEYSVDMITPTRISSFFVYLTSIPPGGGGETFFCKLGLKIRPQRGTAVLWCNVDPNNVFKADPMVIHRANPVKGNHEKIGLNIWIQHL